MPPGGIRTHNLSRREPADQRLRLRGQWDRHISPEISSMEEGKLREEKSQCNRNLG